MSKKNRIKLVSGPSAEEISVSGRGRRILLRLALGGLIFRGDRAAHREDEDGARTLEKTPDRKEVEAQRKIEEVEAGFFEFRNRLYAKLGNSPEHQKLEGLFRTPFSFVSGNMQTNPDRNLLTYERKKNLQPGSYTFYSRMIRFFISFTARDLTDSAAHFEPLPRIMALSPYFDPESDADNLVLLHELFHVAYDTQVRSTVSTSQGWQLYRRFYRYKPEEERPRLNVVDEARASSMELEAMNVLLDGKLKQAVQQGGAVDLRQILHELGATKPHQISPMTFTIKSLAHAYFSDGEKMRGLNKVFLDQIASAAKERGCDVWIPSEDGKSIAPYRW